MLLKSQYTLKITHCSAFPSKWLDQSDFGCSIHVRTMHPFVVSKSEMSTGTHMTGLSNEMAQRDSNFNLALRKCTIPSTVHNSHVPKASGDTEILHSFQQNTVAL